MPRLDLDSDHINAKLKMLHINMQPDVKKNERDFLNGGLTPLMVAVKHKHVEAVRKMVKLKVKVQISTYTFQDCQHHVT